MRAVTRLTWKTLCGSRDPKFNVAGTELAKAIVPGTRSVYSIVSIRGLDADREPTEHFSVRKNGFQIARFDDEDEAIRYASELR